LRDFVENFFLFSAVKEFWKSVKIWQSYCQKFGGFLFFGTQCTGWAKKPGPVCIFACNKWMYLTNFMIFGIYTVSGKKTNLTSLVNTVKS